MHLDSVGTSITTQREVPEQAWFLIRWTMRLHPAEQGSVLRQLPNQTRVQSCQAKQSCPSPAACRQGCSTLAASALCRFPRLPWTWGASWWRRASGAWSEGQTWLPQPPHLTCTLQREELVRCQKRSIHSIGILACRVQMEEYWSLMRHCIARSPCSMKGREQGICQSLRR